MKCKTLRPKGFEEPYFPKHVYRVVKALYGLHQAPRGLLLVSPYIKLLPTDFSLNASVKKENLKYLEGNQNKASLLNPKDSPFQLDSLTGTVVKQADYCGVLLHLRPEYVAALAAVLQYFGIQKPVAGYGLQLHEYQNFNRQP
ncbi:hypothetical protein Tco_1577401 [Tanacetum coccineum]